MMSIRRRAVSGLCLATVAATLVGRLMEMSERARQRRHLAGLSDWQLQDIGLSRADVEAETAKPCWRLN